MPCKHALVSGFNLIRRFSLQKMSSVKKIKNPKGPIIMRLGGARLVESTSQVFPHGFPDQFTLVVTLLLKKQTTDEDWYLFQISDHLGYPQISIGVNGKDRTVSLQARGQDKEYVGSTFAGQGLYSLFDNGWHKIVLSVQEKMASIHIDCSFISFKPIEPRAPLAMDGHTFIGLNTVNGSPVHIDIQKFLLYCDPLMAMQEGCCEILPAGCGPEAPKTRRNTEASENMPDSNLIELSSKFKTQSYTRCFCLEDSLQKKGEKVTSGMPVELPPECASCAFQLPEANVTVGPQGPRGHAWNSCAFPIIKLANSTQALLNTKAWGLSSGELRHCNSCYTQQLDSQHSLHYPLTEKGVNRICPPRGRWILPDTGIG
ncbi:Hypothetical predicted protein [Pelobates cultripes]|uniref:Collagen alpha-1(XVI) chain n=1 Tax=Pelobates cultripes TaxID=61616 RepID=A0AAD1VMT8_PELCU|nr:Hypothetical predicted protein [Pelobates cultripes]